MIIRKRSDRFAQIPNDVADDPRLSADCLGVLTYLLAKPDGWRVNIKNLQNRFNMGRKVYRLIDELIEAGYISRHRERHEDGRFSEMEYHVFDAPHAPSPHVKDPHVQNRHVENGDTYKETNPVIPKRNKTQDIKRARATPVQELQTVLDQERAMAVVEHRQRIRKPLTAHAAKLLAAQLGKVPDPNEAADAMICNGWQGFKPEWLENRQRAASPPSRPRRETLATAFFDEEPQNEPTPYTIDGYANQGHDAGYSPGHASVIDFAGAGKRRFEG